MKAIVVGAGISGIAAASWLEQHGVSVTLFESAAHCGGRVGPVAFGDRTVELGGRNIQGTPAILELLAAHGVTEFDGYSIDSVSIGNPHHLDFRQTGGRVRALTRLLQNVWRLGPRSLLRVRSLRQAARGHQDGSQIGSSVWRALAEATADTTTVHYFGARAADGIFRPWTIRTMGSEPEEVYVGNLAPILGRAAVPIRRVRGGMGVFFRAVDQKLAIRYRHEVTQLRTDRGRVVGIAGIAEGGKAFEQNADLVVIALPAPAAAALLAAGYAGLSRALGGIAYRPVATVIATYRSAQFPGGLGGVFLPRGEAVSHISKQSGSDGTTLRFSFAGIAARPWLRPGVSEEELVQVAEKTMLRFGGKLGERVRQVSRVWLPGVCGQSWMHHRTLDVLAAGVAAAPGLCLAGDYFQSASLDGCVASTQRNVREALSRIAENS